MVEFGPASVAVGGMLTYHYQVTQTYFQKGFGLRGDVRPILLESYHNPLVERLKALDYQATIGDLRFKLAREFGFCYGVDRAVEYAYETRQRFPDRRTFLIGEIIHNPDVNARLQQMGIVILPDAKDPVVRYADIDSRDVVILPAFGVPIADMAHLTEKGCVLVDTTCGSVLNVWKMVHRCARDGYTVIIHGKNYHEETRATASQALTHPGGRYLCVRNPREADVICGFLRGTVTADDVRAQFASASSPNFDPDVDLDRIGLANQTTMLSTESLAIQDMLRAAMRDRVGDSGLAHHFRAFDTICSATQDRQDAVHAMLDAGDLDVMIVIGGYNSSNTQALANMCAPRVPTFHIDSPTCVEASRIRHRPVGGGAEQYQHAWLADGPRSIGLTAGASTPDSVVGGVIERLLAVRGHGPEALMAIEPIVPVEAASAK
jgi:4-hydroxy-3-methylbut-2-enyl diphosphate reductase